MTVVKFAIQILVKLNFVLHIRGIDYPVIGFICSSLVRLKLKKTKIKKKIASRKTWKRESIRLKRKRDKGKVKKRVRL